MKIKIALLISLVILSNCKKEEKKEMKTTAATQELPFYVGTYTGGSSEGIYRYSLVSNGTLDSIGLAARADNPSFLVKSLSGDYLLAVGEIDNEAHAGTLASYKIQNDTLQLINSRSSGGAHPCFVTVNDHGYVLTANYTGGNIGLHHLRANGELSELLDVQQHKGNDVTERQQGPHAHSAWFVGKNQVIAIDLGTNELWFSALDTTVQKLIPSKQHTLNMAPGAGPRHLTFHPNGKWIYVVNELNGTVTRIIRTGNGLYEVGESITTLPEDFTGANTCADIHCTKDGNFLYASNRGHNSIVIYKVDPKKGVLTHVGFESVRGDGPRNFALSPDEKFLLVANQYTNNIISFKRDLQTGKLEFIDEINAPTPVCILF